MLLPQKLLSGRVLPTLTSCSLVKFDFITCILPCLAGSLGGFFAPLIIGPIVDNVNFNPPSYDCLTGQDITFDDFRLPYGLSGACLVLLATFLYFFVNIEVDKPTEKLGFCAKFGWVGWRLAWC